MNQTHTQLYPPERIELAKKLAQEWAGNIRHQGIASKHPGLLAEGLDEIAELLTITETMNT